MLWTMIALTFFGPLWSVPTAFLYAVVRSPWERPALPLIPRGPFRDHEAAGGHPPSAELEAAHAKLRAADLKAWKLQVERDRANAGKAEAERQQRRFTLGQRVGHIALGVGLLATVQQGYAYLNQPPVQEPVPSFEPVQVVQAATSCCCSDELSCDTAHDWELRVEPAIIQRAKRTCLTNPWTKQRCLSTELPVCLSEAALADLRRSVHQLLLSLVRPDRRSLSD